MKDAKVGSLTDFLIGVFERSIANSGQDHSKLFDGNSNKYKKQTAQEKSFRK
jgi:predicted nucleic-acid-binding Zn-ribbon protein